MKSWDVQISLVFEQIDIVLWYTIEYRMFWKSSVMQSSKDEFEQTPIFLDMWLTLIMCGT